jgi:hypothetical protein
MQFRISDRWTRVLTKYRRFLPACAFLAGFLWDSLTLGRRITSIDLFILLAYYSAAALILFTIGRRPTFRYSEYLNVALQFFIGGIFSALVIFYFLSASAGPGFAIVLILAALLVINEFLERHYSRLTLSWTVFGVCGVMFFNFALPHLFGSVSAGWFYLSTLLAIAFAVALWSTASPPRANIWPATGIALLLLAAHSANLIPPVPLVKKQMLIAHEITRTGDRYVMRVERPERGKFWQTASPTFHWSPGERVYCFTSVFVPRGISTRITHRWEFLDPRLDEWVDTTVLTFPIAGGRESGYRGFTFKRNVQPGAWRVIAESEAGATIGVLRFTIEPGEPRRLRRVVR